MYVLLPPGSPYTYVLSDSFLLSLEKKVLEKKFFRISEKACL